MTERLAREPTTEGDQDGKRLQPADRREQLFLPVQLVRRGLRASAEQMRQVRGRSVSAERFDVPPGFRGRIPAVLNPLRQRIEGTQGNG